MACEAARHGLSVRIVDVAAQGSDKSKALVLWSRTMEIFARADQKLTEDALACGHRVHGSSMYADGTRIVHVALDELPSPFPFALMVPQCDTERLLAESLTRRGITVERRVQLTTFVQDAEGVTATLRHADGREETVRTSHRMIRNTCA